MITLWKYETAPGCPMLGTVKAVVEGQGTDVAYHMIRQDDGTLDVVSGERLKTLQPIGQIKQKDSKA